MKLTVTKSAHSAHFYVQKTIRLEKGGTTSVTVEKLGNLEEVTTKAHGGDPYKWAQEYVNELNRREYEEQKSIIVSYSPSRLIEKGTRHSYNCGYLFLQDIYYRLRLDKICKDISSRHSFEYDLDRILRDLTYTRIMYPSSKLRSCEQAKSFIEQPTYRPHDVYRALSVLAAESDTIQSELYKNSRDVTERRSDVLYYDCTNFFFELEEEDSLRKYGKSKQHQPLPVVGMGMFMDYDGIPLAFDIYPGNMNEQPTLKPLEAKVIKDYGIKSLIVCTDAGLSSRANRKFNDKTLDGVQVRSFVTTQSVRALPAEHREFALDRNGWKLPGDDAEYCLDDLDPDRDHDRIYYKEKWIVEDLTEKQKEKGAKPLEQRLIVSYSLKYRNYLRKVRQGQIDRAARMIKSGSWKTKARNQNDPARFIGHQTMTDDGEACTVDMPYLDTDAINAEAAYDGFYAICTNEEKLGICELIRLNKKRWEIEECFRIMKTEFRARPVYLQREDRIKAHFLTCFISLVVYRILEKQLGERYTCEELIDTLGGMMMQRPGEKMGYIPAYTRTDITDALHENAGFRTDYEITNDIKMKQIIRKTHQRKK